MLGGSAYYYYTTTQDMIRGYIEENSGLKYDVSALVDSNEQNVDTIKNLEQDQQRIQRDYEQLQSDFASIRSNNNLLREKLAQHEMNYLAYSKPGLVENIINDASDDATRCFELLTGSPFTEKELNAENEKQFNSECPWLWPDSNNP